MTKRDEKLSRCIVDEPKSDRQTIRNTQTGDRYVVDKDSIVVMGLDPSGRFWMSRCAADRVTVITSHRSPPGIGFILQPHHTESPYELRDIEAEAVMAVCERPRVG